MSDYVSGFFDWRYHLREFYDGIIMKAQREKPISLNFSSKNSFVNDSTYFNLIMSHSSGPSHSSVSLYTACFPNKNSPSYSPTKPNKDWGSFNEIKVIPVKGEVHCCTTDKNNNIYVGSNEAIQIINENEILTKDIPSPSFLVRVIPDNSMSSIYSLENDSVIKYNLDNDSIEDLFNVEQPILDISINTQDPTQLLTVQGKKSVLFYDFREGFTQQMMKLSSNATSIAFSNSHQFLFVTGFANGLISLYDFRIPNTPISTIEAHNGAVTSLKWSPHEPDIVASGSQDASIALWSFRQTPNGEVPMVFTHDGHPSPITAFDWSADVPWTLASVSEDNLFEIWTISPSQIEEFI